MTSEREYPSILREALPDEPLSALIADVATDARRTAAGTAPGPVIDVAAGVAFPTAAAFALWAASRARSLGLSRLYFAGRNGRLAYRAHRRLPPGLTGSGSSDYLPISRSVVRRASAAVDLARWIECGHSSPTAYLRQHSTRLPARRLVERVLADADRIADELRDAGIALDRPIPEHQADAWRSLFDRESVRAAIRAEAEPAVPLLLDWLDAHGLLSAERVGLVDVGWRGQQAAMLDQVVSVGSDVKIHHLHLGRNVAEPLLRPTDIERYLIDVDRPLVRNPVALFETLMATDEAALTGLRRGEDGRVEPVRRPGPDAVRESSHVPVIDDVVDAAMTRLAADLTPEHLHVDLRPAVAAVVRRFWERPTVAEARWWGAVPYELDGAGRLVTRLGPPVSARDLPEIARRRSLGPRQWSAGSIAASAGWIRRPLAAIHARRRS